jgi:very-short-patch-repair endonuclease
MATFQKLANHKNERTDYNRAKELRRRAPLVEQILRAELRLATKGADIRFRRQHPLHPYVVDFVCLKLRLIIEIDGMSHDNRLHLDRRRDDYLKSLGYEVMRFRNEDVLENRDGVISAILGCVPNNFT